ncbi:MAG: hypothetical protein BroJett040_21690 [Oligoflexia bacterium]|nr:MAG: hypothetical protein BroJett040_21690 [Oligoflexia bacterium]
MKKYTRNIVALLILFCTLQAPSKTLVVSDIDDTIKISHVLGLADKFLNAPQTSNAFQGMSDLYLYLENKIKPQGIRFVYLSNAPVYLMLGLHLEFLNENGFPKGELLLAPDLSSQENHKITELRRLLSTDRYDQVLLIGDNGERDVEIYDQIQKEFPGVQFLTFIHQVYFSKSTQSPGKLLVQRQVGFVTAVDIAQTLAEKGIFQPQDLLMLNELLIMQIARDTQDEDNGRISFPTWMDCRDFKVKKDLSGAQLYEYYKRIVSRRCSLPRSR